MNQRQNHRSSCRCRHRNHPFVHCLDRTQNSDFGNPCIDMKNSASNQFLKASLPPYTSPLSRRFSSKQSLFRCETRVAVWNKREKEKEEIFLSALIINYQPIEVVMTL